MAYSIICVTFIIAFNTFAINYVYASIAYQDRLTSKWWYKIMIIDTHQALTWIAYTAVDRAFIALAIHHIGSRYAFKTAGTFKADVAI